MPELEPDGHESAGKPKKKDKDLIVEGSATKPSDRVRVTCS
jgi:hypothetical protein